MPRIGIIDTGNTADASRQRLASLKRDIYEERFLGHIEAVIKRRLTDPAAQQNVCAHADETINFVASVTNAIAVVYDYGCRRYLTGDVSEGTADAFASLVRRSEAELKQVRWNVDAWLLGPLFVVPTMRKGAIAWDTITQDQAWAVVGSEEDDTVELLLYKCGALYVEVSSRGWRYLNERGELVPQPELGAPTGEFAVELERAPIAVFRTERPGKDWWSSTRHRGLAAATLSAGYHWAHLGWQRKTGKLLVVKTRKEKLIAGQSTTDAEMPLFFDGEPDEAEVGVVDRTVDPDSHMRTIRFLAEQSAERYGIPGAEVTFDNSNSDWGQVSIQLRREKLAHVQQRQVPHLVTAERVAWSHAVTLARALRLDGSANLPPADELSEMLTIEFPDLEVVTDPKTRLELANERMKLGLTTPAREYQRDNPSLTITQCREQVMKNLEENAAHLDFLARRNMSKDFGQGVQTLAQQHGAQGGRQRAINQQQDQESDGDGTTASGAA